MYNICLQNVMEWKYKVADNGITQLKYSYLKFVLKSNCKLYLLLYIQSLLVVHFDTRFFILYTKNIFHLNISYQFLWLIIIVTSIGPEKHILVDP